MDTNTNKLKEELKGEMKKMRGEMRQVGQCLQADKMAMPRAGLSELKGSAPAGEDRVIRETCKTRHEVTERKKVNGVTETCTRETGREVTELTGTRETVEERLHSKDGVVGDTHTRTHTHTHRVSEGQWGRARRACGDPVRAAGCPPSGMRGGSMPP